MKEKEEGNWTNETVKCDLCGHEWNAIYETSCTHLECLNCGNMVQFTIITEE